MSGLIGGMPRAKKKKSTTGEKGEDKNRVSDQIG